MCQDHIFRLKKCGNSPFKKTLKQIGIQLRSNQKKKKRVVEKISNITANIIANVHEALLLETEIKYIFSKIAFNVLNLKPDCMRF